VGNIVKRGSIHSKEIVMEVKIDTSCKTYLDCRGKFPVGHIKVLMNHYVDMADNLELLLDVYQKRIEQLEASDNPHKDILIRELKSVFIEGRCDWEAESIYDKPIGIECDMQLRHYPDERLG
jgi:hypothetical protein